MLFDIIFLVALVIFAVVGYVKGFLKTVATLLSIVLAAIFAGLITKLLSGIFTNTVLVFVLSFAVLLVILLIVLRLIADKVDIPILSFVDSIIGAALGILQWAAIVFVVSVVLWVVVSLFGADSGIFSKDYLMNSKIVSFVCSKNLSELISGLFLKFRN